VRISSSIAFHVTQPLLGQGCTGIGIGRCASLRCIAPASLLRNGRADPMENSFTAPIGPCGRSGGEGHGLSATDCIGFAVPNRRLILEFSHETAAQEMHLLW
jgi:hypothetical protein